MTLSVVIPIYNSEQYLDDCLRSVCALTEEDVEIICVIDGSPDRSADIVREWQRRDARVRLIEQENMGVSAARNTGLDSAGGEYIYFLDSDDMLSDTQTFLNCVRRMRSEKLDVLIGAATVLFDPPEMKEGEQWNAQWYFTVKNVYPEVCVGSELIGMLRRNKDWCAPPCTKIYRRGFLKDNGQRFIVGQEHEDEYFTLCTLFLAKRVGVTQEPIYIRRVRPGSIMTKALSHRRVLGNLINMTEMLRFLERHRDIRELDPDIGSLIREARNNAAELYLSLSDKERSLYLASLRPDLLFYHTVFVEDAIQLSRQTEEL